MFNVKIGHMPVSLEPSKVMFMEHFLILQCFAQTLVRLNEDGNIIGDLASSWSFSNKGKTVTFTIDKNHSFSNGDGVTAQDVLNSFKSHFEGSNNSAVKGYIEKIVDSKSTSSYEPNIVVLGDNKIQFHLKGAYPPFLHLLAMPGFSVTKKIENKIIGSGPMTYEFKEDSINLTRREEYTGSKPTIAKINISSSKESDIPQLINDKKIDIAIGFNILKKDQLTFAKHVKYTKSSSLAIGHIYLNTKKSNKLTPELREYLRVKIQQAATDKNNRTDLQEYAPTFIPEGVLPNSYYAKRIQSKHEYKSEKEISLKLVTLGSTFKDSFFDTIKKELLDNKIKLEIVRLNAKEFREAMVTENYDLIAGRYIGNFPDPDGFISVVDQNMKLKYGAFESNLIKSLEKVRFNPDKSERLTKYSDLLKDFEAQNYIIPLFKLNISILHHKDLKIAASNFRYESELWRIFWTN